jgi:hypothetical protein
MRGGLLVVLALVLCPLPPGLAQSPTGTIAQVDARAEVAAVLYAASATQAAAERVADAKLSVDGATSCRLAHVTNHRASGSAPLRAGVLALDGDEQIGIAAFAPTLREIGPRLGFGRMPSDHTLERSPRMQSHRDPKRPDAGEFFMRAHAVVVSARTLRTTSRHARRSWH